MRVCEHSCLSACLSACMWVCACACVRVPFRCFNQDARCVALQIPIKNTAHRASQFNKLCWRFKWLFMYRFMLRECWHGPISVTMLPRSWIPRRVKEKREVRFQCSMIWSQQAQWQLGPVKLGPPVALLHVPHHHTYVEGERNTRESS